MNLRAFKETYKLPLSIFGAFLFAAIWVGIGRVVFGVFGWLAFLTVFIFAPVILAYGAALASVVAARQRTYVFRKNGPFMKSLYITLIALFVLGLSMPDAGDTAGSGGSALAVLLGGKADGGFMALSGTLVFLSIPTAVIASVITFALAFLERTPRPKAATPKSTLKQSS